MKYLVLAVVLCGCDTDFIYPIKPNVTGALVVNGTDVGTPADAAVIADAETLPPIDARPDAPPPVDAE